MEWRRPRPRGRPTNGRARSNLSNLPSALTGGLEERVSHGASVLARYLPCFLPPFSCGGGIRFFGEPRRPGWPHTAVGQDGGSNVRNNGLAVFSGPILSMVPGAPVSNRRAALEDGLPRQPSAADRLFRTPWRSCTNGGNKCISGAIDPLVSPAFGGVSLWPPICLYTKRNRLRRSMNLMKHFRSIAIAVFAGCIGFALLPSLHADEWNKKTF